MSAREVGAPAQGRITGTDHRGGSPGTFFPTEVAHRAYLVRVGRVTAQADATERERSRLELQAARGGHGAIGAQLALVRVVVIHGSQVPGHWGLVTGGPRSSKPLGQRITEHESPVCVERNRAGLGGVRIQRTGCAGHPAALAGRLLRCVHPKDSAGMTHTSARHHVKATVNSINWGAQISRTRPISAGARINRVDTLGSYQPSR